MRFDLKFALLVMSNLCVLAWASTADHPLAWITFVAVAQITAASYAVSQGTSPFRWATVGGVIALSALAICLGPLSTIVYLVLGAPQQQYDDFFEDGVAFAVVTPFFLAFFYSPLFMVIGFVCATIVRGIQRGCCHPQTRSAD
jgi:hypothetical protein